MELLCCDLCLETQTLKSEALSLKESGLILFLFHNFYLLIYGFYLNFPFY